MFRNSLLATAFLLGFSVPAFAKQCPVDMGKIDAAMKTASLSAAQKAKVGELRAKGEELHKAGKHGESVSTLAEAKKILGVK